MTNTISIWKNTWSPLGEFRRELDSVFGEWGHPTAQWATDESYMRPACDIHEENDQYLLALEIPGVSKDDIRIEAIDNQLVVSGERRMEAAKAEKANLYSERSYGKFRRVFSLAKGIDASKIEANYQDGVLRVLVPKSEAAKPRQIKITNGNGSFLGKFLGHTKEGKEDVHSIAETKESKVVS